jgi:hypothetical protein
MARRTVFWAVVVAVSLALTTLASRSEATLGCSISDPPLVATCDVNEDCDAVGGIGCTSGFCGCVVDTRLDFCPCAETAPTTRTAAPAVSPWGLVTLVALLSAAGLFRLKRRSGPNDRNVG